jgi:hypothetical protein
MKAAVSLLLAAAALAFSPAFATTQGSAAKSKPAATKKAETKAAKKADGKADKAAASKGKDKARKTAKAVEKEDKTPGPLADFDGQDAPDDVVHVANWAAYTRNHRKSAFVLIDKKQARLYVFDPKGKLKSSTPILLGKAVGDHSVPGIGTKPMNQIKEDEKTTPAGRFRAELGRNTNGEDIIWIDYATAVSMHRLRKVKAEEQRAERLATPDVSDNRISYGCVNVPAAFYDRVLRPTVARQGAYIYVLPETKTPQQQFGSFDVPRAG